MHKHPTPLEIKAEIYKQLCLVASAASMLSSDVVLAMNAIEEGMKGDGIWRNHYHKS